MTGMEQTVLINLMAELAEMEEQRTQTRARLERCVRRRRQLAEVRVEEAAEAREAAASARRHAAGFHNAELRVKAAEADLARRRERLRAAGDERQAAALRREIAALEAQLDQLLEQACALMAEGGGQGEGPPVAAGGDPQEADGGLNAGEIRRLELEGTRIDQQIARLVGMVPADVARHVQRLWGQGGHAVVFVQEGACGGCCGRLPVQQGIAVARGKAMVRCPACARYIVHRPFTF